MHGLPYPFNLMHARGMPGVMPQNPMQQAIIQPGIRHGAMAGPDPQHLANELEQVRMIRERQDLLQEAQVLQQMIAGRRQPRGARQQAAVPARARRYW